MVKTKLFTKPDFATLVGKLAVFVEDVKKGDVVAFNNTLLFFSFWHLKGVDSSRDMQLLTDLH